MTASIAIGIGNKFIFAEKSIIFHFLNVFWDDFVKLFSDDLLLRFLSLFSDDIFILFFDDILNFLSNEVFGTVKAVAIGAFGASIIIFAVLLLLFIFHILIWWKYSLDD